MVIKINFDATEIRVISKYVLTNVPYSVLEQVFPLTESPIKKAENFTIMYRIINSAKNYINEEKTKNKLIELLNNCKDEYIEIYKCNMRLKSEVNIGKHYHERTIRNILSTHDRNERINNLIDIFLIFAEKHVLQDIEKIIGINTEDIASGDIMDKMSSTVID